MLKFTVTIFHESGLSEQVNPSQKGVVMRIIDGAEGTKFAKINDGNYEEFTGDYIEFFLLTPGQTYQLWYRDNRGEVKICDFVVLALENTCRNLSSTGSIYDGRPSPIVLDVYENEFVISSLYGSNGNTADPNAPFDYNLNNTGWVPETGNVGGNGQIIGRAHGIVLNKADFGAQVTSIERRRQFEPGCSESVLSNIAITQVFTPPSQAINRKLYHVQNIFLLSDGTNVYEIEEPIKWDDVLIQIVFDRVTFSYRYEFSDGDVLLEFDEAAGMSIIKEQYRLFQSEANVSLKFGEIVNDVLTIHFEAQLNFEEYEENEFVVQCNVERKSLQDKLRTRFDTKVIIDDGTESQRSIDGTIIGTIPKNSIYLHPRLIPHDANFEYNQNVLPTNFTLLNTSAAGVGSRIAIPPFKIVSNNVQGAQEPTPPEGVILYQGELDPFTTKRNISVSSQVRFQFTIPQNTIQTIIVFYRLIRYSNYASGYSLDDIDVIYEDSQDIGNLAGTYTMSKLIDANVDIFSDTALTLTIQIRCMVDTNFDVTNFNWLDVETYPYLSMHERTVTTPSEAQGYKIFEVINRQLHRILDKNNALKSNFFGRTDLGYDQDGPGSGNVLLSGKMLRSLPGQNMYLSAKEWFNSLSAIYCLGMCVERDNDNNEYVRLEPIEYFFRNILLYRFSVISKYSKKCGSEYIFNELEFGFKKYPENNEDNSADDWMTKFLYITPIKAIKNKLSKISDLLLSSYYIEYTRRESFRENPKNQFETDNDNFMIAVKSATDLISNVTAEFISESKSIICQRIVPVVEGDTIVISDSTSNNGGFTIVSVEIDRFYQTTTSTVLQNIVDEASNTINITLEEERSAAKRDEDFSAVENIFSKESAYNLENHIKRIFKRWAKYFNSGLTQYIDNYSNSSWPYISFTSGSNNIELSTRKPSESLSTTDKGFENIKDNLQRPLFKANIIEFEAQMSWDELNNLRKAFENRSPDNKNFGYFEWVDPFGVTERGYLLSLKFNPIKQMSKFMFVEKYS